MAKASYNSPTTRVSMKSTSVASSWHGGQPLTQDWISYMLPFSVCANIGDRYSRNASLIRDFGHPFSSIQELQDEKYILNGYLSVATIFTEYLLGMLVVFCLSYDLEIFQPIIYLVTVLVVYGLSSKSPKEGLGNHAMNISHGLFAALAKNNLQVPIWIQKRQPIAPRKFALISDFTAYISEAADFVKLVSYGLFPLFHLYQSSTELALNVSGAHRGRV